MEMVENAPRPIVLQDLEFRHVVATSTVARCSGTGAT
jgi:hypothetical protein